MSAQGASAIEALQPYNGVEWTKTLRDISNPDKHRELTALCDSGYYMIAYTGQNSLATKPPIDVDNWDVDASYAIYVSPPDLSKPSLLPTLHSLHAELSRAYHLFKAEF